MRVVIIGGVAGGMSAAARLRRLDDGLDVVVLEKSGHVSYANCGLPYFVGGVIEDESSLLLQTPQSLHERFRLDVRVRHEVLSIDREAKKVSVRALATGDDYELDYDVLVMSPGASPIVPPIEGVERAFTLRTIEDVERIDQAVSDAPRSAVVVGGGFVGVEIAENLIRRGVATTVVEAAPQVMAPLDAELAGLVAEEMCRHGVSVRLGETVARIDARSVVLDSGEHVDAELVVVAIGVRPETGLARDAGLAIGARGGIQVDDYQRTSDPSIYAIGDAVEKRDALDGGATLVALANVANRQGRVVADHITGRDVRATSTVTTAIVKVFDLTVATTGWNERRLRASGREVLAIHTHPTSHAGYYPGARSMALKLLVDPSTGAILGAQGVGTEGVDKRIDVLATALQAGLTAPELADLELAYAPPFSSAKDPVNMLGYVAENRLAGLDPAVQWYEVADAIARGVQILDVRRPEEYARGSIPGAHHVPLDELRLRTDEVNAEVVVYCEVGQRGHVAVMLLRQLGVDAKNLDGGYATWRQSPANESRALVRQAAREG